ncbi:MAG: hypothetical protein HCAMLNBO_02622 [Candidatus Brocadia fulgida]|nr:hypothetical protein [Candidatus Brocadia fulgida]
MLKRSYLLANFFHHLRVAVPGIHYRHPAIKIQILLARMVIEVLHLAPDDLHRFPVKMVNAGNQIFLLFLKNGIRADMVCCHGSNNIH